MTLVNVRADILLIVELDTAEKGLLRKQGEPTKVSGFGKEAYETRRLENFWLIT